VTSYDGASNTCQAHCPPLIDTHVNPRVFYYFLVTWHLTAWRAISARPFCKALREGLRGGFAPSEIVLHGSASSSANKEGFSWGGPMPLASDILSAPPTTKLGRDVISL